MNKWTVLETTELRDKCQRWLRKSQWIICNISNTERKLLNVPFLRKVSDNLSLLSFLYPYSHSPMFLTYSWIHSTSAFEMKNQISFMCNNFKNTLIFPNYVLCFGSHYTALLWRTVNKCCFISGWVTVQASPTAAENTLECYAGAATSLV